MQAGAREEFFAQVAARQDEALGTLKSGFEEKFGQARELLGEIARQAETLRAESGNAQEATGQVARALLQLEAADAARTSKAAGPSKEEIAAEENAVAAWRQRLESEMTVAQGQWNELLQSSLDNNLQRMVEQLAERSQEVLRNAEQKMTERLGELRQPFAQAAAEARETFSGIQSALEQEVLKARSSLAEVKQVASRTEEFSAQLEAASQDTVNELHRRLERILDAQTSEMHRRMENLSADVAQRAVPVLDSLSHQFQERAVAEAEAKLAPHLERVPALLHELAAREVQLEDSLRLHRERLRQVSENNQREVAAQVAGTLASLHADFEAARKDALAKWSEELEASGVRASHAAAESIGHTSEWLQQEARARLQALVEQSFVTADAGLGQRSADAGQKFETQLAAQSAAHLGQIRAQVEGVAGEVVARTRTDLDRAAEAAAASFGQLVHEVSERETTQFAATTATTRRERAEEFDHATQELLHQLDVNAFSSVERFRAQMASQWEIERRRRARGVGRGICVGARRFPRGARRASERMVRAAGAHDRRRYRKVSGSAADHGRFLGDGFGAAAERARAERNRIAAAVGRPGATRFLLESFRWPGADAARTHSEWSGRRQRGWIYAGRQSRHAGITEPAQRCAVNLPAKTSWLPPSPERMESPTAGELCVSHLYRRKCPSRPRIEQQEGNLLTLGMGRRGDDHGKVRGVQ